MSWPCFWQKKTVLTQVMRPLGALTCWVAARRLKKFRKKTKNTKNLKNPLPAVIVVGNVVVGGSGKTPFIQWLGRQLQAQGIPFGVISRGYGGQAAHYPLVVTPQSDPKQAGDEPVLLAQSLQCPVVVSPKRADALAELVRLHPEVQVVVSDDGLQHFALPRTKEVVLIESERQLGNGLCLPAGPLREPADRLASVDAIVCNGGRVACEKNPLLQQARGETPLFEMVLRPVCFRQVSHPKQILPLDAFQGQTVIAMAGIGNPKRFFETLKTLGIEVMEQPLKDHQVITPVLLSKLQNTDPTKPLLMTQKDAVKCQDFAPEQAWYLEIIPECDEALLSRFLPDFTNRTEKS